MGGLGYLAAGSSAAGLRAGIHFLTELLAVLGCLGMMAQTWDPCRGITCHEASLPWESPGRRLELALPAAEVTRYRICRTFTLQRSQSSPSVLTFICIPRVIMAPL